MTVSFVSFGANVCKKKKCRACEFFNFVILTVIETFFNLLLPVSPPHVLLAKPLTI